MSLKPLIASDRARFSERFVRLGLSCDVGGWREPTITAKGWRVFWRSVRRCSKVDK